MGSAIKNLPVIQEMQETQVRSLGWEDPLEEGMATHSSILAWRIPWTEESGVLQSMRSHRVGYNWATKHTCTQFKVLYLTLTSPSHWGHHERRGVHKYTVATITPGSTKLCLLLCDYSLSRVWLFATLCYSTFFLNGPALTLGHCNLL